MRTVSQEEFDRTVEHIKAIRRSPGYASEFPPSSLIDDTPEGIVGACYKVDRDNPHYIAKSHLGLDDI